MEEIGFPAEEFDGPITGIAEGPRIESAEDKSSAVPCFRHVVLDGIGQAADFMDNGKGAIFEAIHLGQATRLIPGRHEEKIGPGNDVMGELFIEPDQNADLFRKPMGEIAKIAFHFRIARAENHEADILREQPLRDVPDQIDPLLAGEAGDTAEDRHVAAGEIELLKQRLLARRLSLEISRGEMGGSQGIVLRIPKAVVNTVEDTGDLVPVLIKHAVEATAEVLRLNLLGIAGANRGNLVRQDNATFQAIQPAVELDAGAGEVFAGQIRQPKVQAPEITLIGEIVDREDRLERKALRANEGGNKGRLPIMGVDDVGKRIEVAGQLHDRLAEKDKPAGIVRIVPAAAAVELTTVIIFITLNEKESNAGFGRRLPDVGLMGAVADLDRELKARWLHVGKLFGQALIKRKGTGNRMAPLPKDGGQGGEDVTETAAFRVGRKLAAGKENVHGGVEEERGRKTRRGKRTDSAFTIGEKYASMTF